MADNRDSGWAIMEHRMSFADTSLAVWAVSDRDRLALDVRAARKSELKLYKKFKVLVPVHYGKHKISQLVIEF